VAAALHGGDPVNFSMLIRAMRAVSNALHA